MNYILVGLLLLTQTSTKTFNVPWDSRTVADGLHTFSVEVLDEQGNKTIKEVPFVVDNTKPVIKVTGVVGGGFYSGKVNLTITAIDITSPVTRLELCINGTSRKTSTNGGPMIFEWNTNPLKRSSPKITVIAVDKPGNLETYELQVTIR